MQNDEIVWHCINNSFCSYKIKSKTQNFCQSPYNISGLCSRISCPLANSKYCTVIEKKGECFLYMKTVERAHIPRELWNKVKLPPNYLKSLEIINEHLMYWPKFLVNRAKARLTKIHQYLLRMRKAKLAVPLTKLVAVDKKREKILNTRESLAEKKAKIDDSLKNELLQRLKAGIYGDAEQFVNIPQKSFDTALDEIGEEEKEEVVSDLEYVEDMEDFNAGDMEDFNAGDMEDFNAGDMEDFNAGDMEDFNAGDMEDFNKDTFSDDKQKKKQKKKRNIEIEYENEPISKKTLKNRH